MIWGLRKRQCRRTAGTLSSAQQDPLAFLSLNIQMLGSPGALA